MYIYPITLFHLNIKYAWKKYKPSFIIIVPLTLIPRLQ